MPTLLIVDDEPIILQLLTLHLQRDFQVIPARNAEQALIVLNERPVDLILCDHRMPGMTGIELLKRARAMRPQAVRILLSGSADPTALISAINDAGVHKFIPKPWDQGELVKLVHDQIVTRSRELHLGA